ncbi:MAG: ATPase [Clostridia bacterium]|nr:ATPase [Clostridia bacterium]
METLELINQLEDIIDNSVNIPLMGKSLIEKDELLDVIQELRLKLPDDLKQAKWIKDERQRILLEAQKEASAIIKEAEDKIVAMINEDEITKRATDQATEIINNANRRAKEIKMGTRQYVDEKLADVEKVLDRTISSLRDNRNIMQQKDLKKQMKFDGISPIDDMDDEI